MPVDGKTADTVDDLNLYNSGHLSLSNESPLPAHLSFRHSLQHSHGRTALMMLLLTSILLATLSNSASASKGTFYDENTEVVVHGVVKHPKSFTFRGLNCLEIESRGRVLYIITAPQWFIDRLNLKLPKGTEIQVVGSKFYGNDGAIYIVARSLKTLPSGRSIPLRDSKCRPVWSKEKHKKSSCMKIFYSPNSI